MYVCMHVCISIHLSIYPSIHLSIYLSIYLCMYLCIYVSMYLSIYASMHLCIYASMYLWMDGCMNVCFCILHSGSGDFHPVFPHQWPQDVLREVESIHVPCKVASFLLNDRSPLYQEQLQAWVAQHRGNPKQAKPSQN